MQWNEPDPRDASAEDDGAWETVEIAPLARIAAKGRPSLTLVGGLLVLGTLVGVGIWPLESAVPQASSSFPHDCATTPSAKPVEVEIAADLPAAESVAAPPRIVLLMPAEGEVVVGTVIPLAGRISGPRPGPAEAQPAILHVVIVIGDAILGEADVQVAGHGFVGAIQVPEPSQGRIADLWISDGRDPDQVLLQQRFVLGPSH